MKENKEQIWSVVVGSGKQKTCKSDSPENARRKIHARLISMSYEDFCAAVPLTVFAADRQITPKPNVQYYITRPRQAFKLDNYKDDGWIYRRINEGPFKIRALFNCEMLVPYLHRNSLVNDLGDDLVLEEYDYDDRDPTMVPISVTEAKQIMKKWRKLSKRWAEDSI